MRMCRQWYAVAVAAGCMMSSQAHAQTYIGAGSPCVQYLGMLTSNDPFQRQLSQSVQQWGLGYVSGLNMMWKTVKGTDPLLTVEGPQVVAYLQRFCRANPGRTVLNAANDYFFSLPK